MKILMRHLPPRRHVMPNVAAASLASMMPRAVLPKQAVSPEQAELPVRLSAAVS